MKRLIRVSSRALGERIQVRVLIYDDLRQMRRDAEAFNSQDHRDAVGVTHAWVDDDDRALRVVIRLWSGRLGTQVVSHEMHHAATALYGATTERAIDAREHLNHFNEPFAHLFSDLLQSLVDRLYAIGYYDDGGARVSPDV